MMTIQKSLRAFAIVTGLALAFISPVLAQGTPAAAPAEQNVDPARLAAARDLLQASKMEQKLAETLPAMFEQMTGPMLEHFAARLGDEKNREEFRKMSTALVAVTQKHFVERRGELLDIIAKVYARTFTVEEMNAVAAFLRTPVGTRFVDSTPALQQKIIELFTNLATGKPLPKPAETDPAKLAAARRMFEASKLDATLDAMLAAIPQPQGGENAPENAFLKNLKSRRGEIVDVLAATYAEAFTVEEMTEVTAFYTSPQGVKLVEALPSMMQETSRATTDYAQQFAADLSKKMVEELQKTKP